MYASGSNLRLLIELVVAGARTVGQWGTSLASTIKEGTATAAMSEAGKVLSSRSDLRLPTKPAGGWRG
jgi:hypothetical protein